MAEAARKARRNLLGLMGKISGALLAALGVITPGCGNDPVDYGVPPAVSISGDIVSGEDKIQGIQVRMVSPVSSDILDLFTSDENGHFWLSADISHFSPPDSVMVQARDVDGELNGSFLPGDTLLFFDEDPYGNPEILVHVDIELTPDEN